MNSGVWVSVVIYAFGGGGLFFNWGRGGEVKWFFFRGKGGESVVAAEYKGGA